jgi:hypothetical protein
MKGCIATVTELWFEKPGFPSGPAARAPRKPVEERVSLADAALNPGGGNGSG